jgi:hypothetical protein
MNLQGVGRRNQDRDQNQNHHRKQRLRPKEKLVQEKNVVPLVKRKASDEKRDRDNNPPFICNTCYIRLPIKWEYRNIFPVNQK